MANVLASVRPCSSITVACSGRSSEESPFDISNAALVWRVAPWTVTCSPRNLAEGLYRRAPVIWKRAALVLATPLQTVCRVIHGVAPLRLEVFRAGKRKSVSRAIFRNSVAAGRRTLLSANTCGCETRCSARGPTAIFHNKIFLYKKAGSRFRKNVNPLFSYAMCFKISA